MQLPANKEGKKTVRKQRYGPMADKRGGEIRVIYHASVKLGSVYKIVQCKTRLDSTVQRTQAQVCMAGVLKGKADAVTSEAAKLSSFCPKTLAVAIKFTFAIFKNHTSFHFLRLPGL